MIETLIMTLPAADAPDEAASSIETLRAMLLVLGIVIIAVMLVLSARGKIARRQSNRPSAREQIDRAKSGGAAGMRKSEESADASQSAYRAAAARAGRATPNDVEDARRLAAALDNKAERLEQLLAEAEDRIARLEQMLSTHESSEPVASEQSPIGDESAARPARMHDASDIPADPLTRSVYELADEGHNSVEIARRLDEQVGKIELILALRR